VPGILLALALRSSVVLMAAPWGETGTA